MLPTLIGREKELKQLQEALDKGGATVLVSGEEGVGKTVFVESIIPEAIEKNYQILLGKCPPEAATPFGPFVKILKSANLEHLLSAENPKVQNLLYSYRDGRLIENVQSETGICADPELVMGMFSAVKDFGQTSFDKGELNQLKFKDLDLVVVQGKYSYVVAAVTGGISESLQEDLRKLVDDFESKNPNIAAWDGVRESLGDLSASKQLLSKYKGELDASTLKNEKDRIFDRVTEGLKALDKKTLLILDDLHCADPSTLQLLQYLARNTKNSNVTVFGTFRPEEGTSFNETFTKMSRENLCEKIDLQRLAPEHIRAIIASKYNVKPELIEEFAKQLHARTEGNPFYVHETLCLLEQQNVIKQGQDWWTNINLENIAIPKTIQEIIKQRLSNLDSATYKTLKYAAVLGQEFNPKVLRKALKLEDEVLGEQLEQLLEKNILKRKNGSYAFDQASIKDVVYAGLESASKRAIHLTAAKTIENLYQQNMSDHVTELAWHYTKVAENLEEPLDLEEDLPILQKAIDCNSKAGAQVKQKYAHEEAAHHFETSLKFLETLESKLSGEQKLEIQKQKLAVVDELQQLYFLASKWKDSVKYSEQLIATAQKLSNKEKELDGLIACGLSEWYLSQYGKAVASYENAIRLSEQLGNKKKGALAYNRLGSSLATKGELDKGLEFLKKSLELAEQANDKEEIWRALRNTGIAYHQTAEGLTKATEYYRKSSIVAKDLGNKEYANSLSGLGAALVELGNENLKEGLDILESAVDMLKSVRDSQSICTAYDNLGIGYAKTGNLSKAKEYFDLGLQLAQKLGWQYGIDWISKDRQKYLENKNF
jgi:predicted ATPase